MRRPIIIAFAIVTIGVVVGLRWLVTVPADSVASIPLDAITQVGCLLVEINASNNSDFFDPGLEEIRDRLSKVPFGHFSEKRMGNRGVNSLMMADETVVVAEPRDAKSYWLRGTGRGEVEPTMVVWIPAPTSHLVGRTPAPTSHLVGRTGGRWIWARCPAVDEVELLELHHQSSASVSNKRGRN